MIPAFHYSSATTANDTLFKQYKQQLKKKENQAAKRERAERNSSNRSQNNSIPPSLTNSQAGSEANSLQGTPAKPARPQSEIQYDTPLQSPFPSLQQTPRQSPGDGNGLVSWPATARPTPSTTRPQPRRLTPEEINTRWKEIFSTLEKWTAEEDAPIGNASSKGISAAAVPRVPSSYAAAAAAQRAYEAECIRHGQIMQGYNIQHALLVEKAASQKLNGLRPGERKVPVPAPPPPAPTMPPITPYDPVFAEVDREWRSSLAANPDALRGDALDHRMVEGKLMSYLLREDHPVTQVKDRFVSNFLEAYSVTRNVNLKGCTTSQASDLLLSNTLPTLIYFLDLLTKLLIRLFPELDAARNPGTMESIRQSSMESIFPSIFPTLFALYKRKYFFRDAELASKMGVLASTGVGCANITLEDLGVSKWFCLDESIVEEARLAGLEKKRMKERARRRAQGETEEQCQIREAEEERKRLKDEQTRVREWKERKAARLKEEAAAAASSANGASSSDVCSPPAIQRSTNTASLRAGLADEEDMQHNTSILPPHPIAALTAGQDANDDPIGADDNNNGMTTLSRSSPKRASGTAPLTPSTPIRTSSGTSLTPSRAIHTPTTRLEPMQGQFEPSSLGRSPRAEKIQDILARSPSRRIMGSVGVSKDLTRGSSNDMPQSSPPPSSSLATSVHTRADRTAAGGELTSATTDSPARKPRSLAGLLSAQPVAQSDATDGMTEPQTAVAANDDPTSLAPPAAASSIVRTPSPHDAKKQVGFSTTGFNVSAPVAEPVSSPPANNNNPAVSPSPPIPSTPSQSGGLAAALKQHRTPMGLNANGDSHTTPPRSTDKSKLGFGANTVGAISNFQLPLSDDDSDASGSSTPRMPAMEGGMPVLGSSMPMLQGLPSSMLTYTPGQGSLLLKKELAQKKENKVRAAQAGQTDASSMIQTTPNRPSSNIPSPQHLAAQQPFVLNSSPGTHVNGHDHSNGDDVDGLGDDEADDGEAAFPYQEAVVLLRRLSFERTPRDKLQCLIAVSQEVCWCVDRFYSRDKFLSLGFRPSPEDLCINADDLLSIVSWILIKSQLANVISEAAFIDDFISRAMKLHMPGYFLATLQASIELITKLDKQKFLTREMVEQELREGTTPGQNGDATGSASSATSVPGQRRPSYLASQSNGAPPLASSLPRPSTKALDTPNHTATHANSNHYTTLPHTGSQPRNGGIKHPQGLTLSAGQILPQSGRAAAPSSRATGSGNAASSSGSSSATTPNRPDHSSVGVPSSGLRNSQSDSNFHPSVTPAVSVTHSTNTRSLSFHSSPGSRVDTAEPTASSNSWSQPFELKLEHFPSPPAKPQSQAPIRKLAHAAMGQTRGVF